MIIVAVSKPIPASHPRRGGVEGAFRDEKVEGPPRFRLFFLIPLIEVIIFLPLTVFMIHSMGKRLMDEATVEAKRTTNSSTDRSTTAC